MKAVQFDCGDFYPLETLLRAVYRRKWYGGYEKTSQVTWSSEVIGIGGEVEHKSHMMTSVIDCTGFDLVKLCLSFVFWTHEDGIPSNVLEWLRRSAFRQLIYQTCNDGSKGLYDRVSNDVASWDHWTLTAAILYLLKYTSRASDWHHAVVRELLVKFLGSNGYGHRDFVFGQHVHSRFTIPYTDALTGKHGCGNVLHPDNVMSQLVAEYNSALSRCPQVPLMVDGLNLGVANARAAKKARDDMVLFLTARLGASSRAVDGVLHRTKYCNIPASIDNLISHTDKLIPLYERQTVHDSHSLYCAITEMKSAKKWTQESCPYCWMAKNGIDKSCKQHVPTVQSQLEVLNWVRTVASANAANAETVSAAPTPTAPPADTDVLLECAVCLTARINTRIAPCGHTCCKGCADRITHCPQCRGEITSRDVIYI